MSEKKIIRVNTDVGPKLQRPLFMADDGLDEDDDNESFEEQSFSGGDEDIRSPTSSTRLDLRGMNMSGGDEPPAPAPEPAPAAAPAPPPAPAPAPAPQQLPQQNNPNPNQNQNRRREFPGIDWLESHDILYNVLRYYLVSSQSRDSDRRVNIVDAILTLNASVNKLVDEFAKIGDQTPAAIGSASPPPAAP